RLRDLLDRLLRLVPAPQARQHAHALQHAAHRLRDLGALPRVGAGQVPLALTLGLGARGKGERGRRRGHQLSAECRRRWAEGREVRVGGVGCCAAAGAGVAAQQGGGLGVVARRDVVLGRGAGAGGCGAWALAGGGRGLWRLEADDVDALEREAGEDGFQDVVAGEDDVVAV
ncbi:MAG: hypothetical protein LQ340_000885, partial [Diploschistes diacapsis]